MALAGNGRWCYLDPKLGAMHAVAEAARKVACTGATPVAATNCLNFGNPEKPEIMAQLSAAIDGIAEACTALGTPITGGNVSLYNETKGEGIYPTPVIGVVGLLEDVSKAVPSAFQRAGGEVFIIASNWDIQEIKTLGEVRVFGSSEYVKTTYASFWGMVPVIEIDVAAALNKALVRLAAESLLTSCCDVSDGGLATALVRATLPHGVGIHVDLPNKQRDALAAYFGEYSSMVVVTCNEANSDRILQILDEVDELYCEKIGRTDGDQVRLDFAGKPFASLSVDVAKQSFSSTLESQLAAEVVTG